MEVSKDNYEFMKRRLMDYFFYRNKIKECENELLEIRDSINYCHGVSSVRYTDTKTKNKNYKDSKIHKLLMEESQIKSRMCKYKDLQNGLKLDDILKSLDKRAKYIFKMHYIENKSFESIDILQEKYINYSKRLHKKIVESITEKYELIKEED